MKCEFIVLPAMLLMIMLADACSAGSKVDLVPVKTRKLCIEDGEYLKYTKTIGGEKVSTVYFVAKVDKASHTVQEFIDMQSVGAKKPIPLNYTNYHYLLKVDTENGYLEEAYFDYHDIPDFNVKMPEFMDTKIDQGNHTASVVMKIKKNEGSDTLHSTIKFKPGYPVWNMTGLLFLGPRCLDIQSKGILYLIEPFYVKDPVSGTFKVIGKEVIETKAGKFHTIKIGFQVTDPLLGSLLNSYTDNMFVWVEDAPRGLIIKSQMNNNINLLEEVSVWK